MHKKHVANRLLLAQDVLAENLQEHTLSKFIVNQNQRWDFCGFREFQMQTACFASRLSVGKLLMSAGWCIYSH